MNPTFGIGTVTQGGSRVTIHNTFLPKSFVPEGGDIVRHHHIRIRHLTAFSLVDRKTQTSEKKTKEKESGSSQNTYLLTGLVRPANTTTAMPTLVLTNFNIVCSVLGGFITVFGLVSYLLKERFYLSEALISLVAGVIFSPHATNWIRPLDYAGGLAENLDTITLYFTRLVLGVQLVLAGVQLPSRYLYTEWRSLALLLGPGMTLMWLSASLLIWAMVPHLSFLHALAVGACVTPTDPVLSNSIVKGKFADKNIPKPLQKIIIAESGANDGLGYPFLFLALYLIKYTQMGGAGQSGGAGKAIGYWFGETWGYTILLSVLYGVAVGWLAKELLHYAEEKKFVDRESFLVFAITLALFITGTCGMIGSDDVLACFVAGNVFTWDDWYVFVFVAAYPDVLRTNLLDADMIPNTGSV